MAKKKKIPLEPIRWKNPNTAPVKVTDGSQKIKIALGIVALLELTYIAFFK